jgi:phage I-like protein
MVMQAGYWVDLWNTKLDEVGPSSTWIQAMPVGKYHHPVYGEIDITPERVARFASNVQAKVRGQDLDIDYDHKERSGEAAGWVKQAEARGQDGLWLLVDWTQEAYNKIKSKAYRYFSPEFTDEWEHPSTKVVHKDVLFGGGLTNRPFLKGIQPINMSEVFDHSGDPKPTQGGSTVTPERVKALANKYGLPEDATEDQVLDAAEKADLKPAEQTTPVAASEDLKKLAETNGAVKTLMDTVEAQQKLLTDVTTALRLSEVNTTVTQLSDRAKAKGVLLSTADTDKLRASLVAIQDKKLSDAMVAFAEGVIDSKVVELGERGKNNGNGTGASGGDPIKVLNDYVAEKRKDNKTSFVDAVTQFASEHPAEYAEYTQASYSNPNDK